MPRLFHRPPKYRLHKSTKQAIVSFNGQKIHLRPYGSVRSHQKYQGILKQWQAERHSREKPNSEKSRQQALADAITPVTLRQKRLHGLTVTIDELVLVYRRHTYEYYRKNGEVTREAKTIDEVIRVLRKKHGKEPIEEFGPTALSELREQMIDDLDWSRQYINKQVPRLVGMFKWAAPAESKRRRRAKLSKNRITPKNQGNSPGSNRVGNPRRSTSDSYTTDSFRRAIKRVCKRHNIENWSPNQLRHTAATEIRKRFQSCYFAFCRKQKCRQTAPARGERESVLHLSNKLILAFSL